MENQTQKLTGYRTLTQVETDLINEIKANGVELGVLVEKLFDHTRQQITDADTLGANTGDFTEFQRLTDAEPHHWVSTGATNLQLGLMALTRAVAQPTTF